jgi:hypothetical protein
VLRFSQLFDLNNKIRAFYELNYPDLLETFPAFPPQKMRIFADHSDTHFIEDRRQKLEAYFDKLVKVDHMATNPILWTYLGLSRCL